MNKKLFLQRPLSVAFVYTVLSLGGVTTVSATQPFLGEVRAFGMHFCPKGWLETKGQLMAINTNQALFSLLGTQYGGDGRTNFALPNLQDRSIIHQGVSNFIGESGGSQTHTLTMNELPTHSHTVVVDSNSNLNMRVGLADSTATISEPTQAAIVQNSSIVASDSSANAKMAVNVQIPVVVTPGTTGGNQSFSTRSPYLVTTYCIAIMGVFPSQN